jgi:hypothetical protein
MRQFPFQLNGTEASGRSGSYYGNAYHTVSVFVCKDSKYQRISQISGLFSVGGANLS